MPELPRTSRFSHCLRPVALAVAMGLCVAGLSALPARAATVAAAAATLEDRFVHFHGGPALAAEFKAAAALDGINPEIDKLLDQPADLFERIRLGFGMPDLDSRIVAQQEAWYAARPDLVRAILQRSRRYLHFIVEQVERRGMPTELALLPFVESGFNPQALSSAQAAGLWQFIPETGTKYNLEQTTFYDARHDVIASTSSALDYLQFLYQFNGNDWHRALASYNWGEHAVARAVERNRVRGLGYEYAALTMPEETRNYVPKLQAIKNIVRNPRAFGLDLEPLPNEPIFAVVRTSHQLDARRAAELAEIPHEEFLALNPAFNPAHPPVVPKAGLAIPLTKVEVFKANLERYIESLAQRAKSAVRRGQVLY
jgi:membrane-bound lytic murein transglycosylase D